MRIVDDLIGLAHDAPSVGAFREAAADGLRAFFAADVALFATLSPAGLGRSDRGFAPDVIARLHARWDAYAPEVGPVQEAALRDGAATDRDVLGADWCRTLVHREIIGPTGGVDSLFVVPAAARAKLGFVMLGRCRSRFGRTEIRVARQIAPALSLACRALAAAEERAPVDGLTATDRDLLDHLELGHSSRDIATARGTSFFTVRNQLSALYRKLHVANRTEAVAHVLRPSRR